MNDVFVSGSVSDQMVSIHDSLVMILCDSEIEEGVVGHIFNDEFLASDWDNVNVYARSLPVGEVQKDMRKVTFPVLLLKSHRSKMAFVLASEECPVYFCSPFKYDKIDGYTMLFSLKPNVWPEYFFYLSKYKTWTGVSHQQDELYKYGLESGFSVVGNCILIGDNEYVEQAETVFLNGALDKTIPSLAVQRQQIDDVKMVEREILDKMSEKERKFQEKEWLNETHIRNSKHRLSGEIMPIRMAVERLEKNFFKSSEGLKLTSVVGRATQQTVGGLLENLKKSIHNIELEIENLTQSETYGESIETIDVANFVREYCDTLASKYNRKFYIEFETKDENLNIKISRKSFMELIDNVISNAVRHGFTEMKRTDYKILIKVCRTKENFCRIDIANNGNAISERGCNEFFVRGSFAGETGHTGIGGARIFEICEHFNGKARKPFSIDGYPVVISVEFPNVSL